MAKQGNRRAQLVIDLEEKYDKLLSTILIGNNIVNILASSMATVIFVGFLGNAGVTVSTVVMTVVVLIFGEISPKTLAKDHADSLALVIAPIINLLMGLFTPFTWLFSQWKKLLTVILAHIEKFSVITFFVIIRNNYIIISAIRTAIKRHSTRHYTV